MNGVVFLDKVVNWGNTYDLPDRQSRDAVWYIETEKYFVIIGHGGKDGSLGNFPLITEYMQIAHMMCKKPVKFSCCHSKEVAEKYPGLAPDIVFLHDDSLWCNYIKFPKTQVNYLVITTKRVAEVQLCVEEEILEVKWLDSNEFQKCVI